MGAHADAGLGSADRLKTKRRISFYHRGSASAELTHVGTGRVFVDPLQTSKLFGT
jgi:hypothetical protein